MNLGQIVGWLVIRRRGELIDRYYRFFNSRRVCGGGLSNPPSDKKMKCDSLLFVNLLLESLGVSSSVFLIREGSARCETTFPRDATSKGNLLTREGDLTRKSLRDRRDGRTPRESFIIARV